MRLKACKVEKDTGGSPVVPLPQQIYFCFPSSNETRHWSMHIKKWPLYRGEIILMLGGGTSASAQGERAAPNELLK